MMLRAVGWARSIPVSYGVRAARTWTREHLESLPWTADAPETVDAILVTVSELVTNAHVHARSPAQLVLTWDSRCLHVSVSDEDAHLPAPRDPSTTATSGRGLAIIDALCDTWDAHARHGGKAITACFRPPGGPDPHDGRPLAG
ncbi:ATP-binding protein [Streptomyces sp. NPDC051555]|uniref:ATP-binding protein n=1 Tax=Streptomyces sp. NPDC051555 TaxID=3365657 RepID=UPI00379BC2D8